MRLSFLDKNQFSVHSVKKTDDRFTVTCLIFLKFFTLLCTLHFPIYSLMNSLSVALFSFLIASFFPLDFIFNVLAYIYFLGYLLTCYVSGSSFVLILCIQSRSSSIQLIVLFFVWNYLILLVCMLYIFISITRSGLKFVKDIFGGGMMIWESKL